MLTETVTAEFARQLEFAEINGAKTFGPTWFAKNVAPYLASEQQRSVGEVILHYQK